MGFNGSDKWHPGATTCKFLEFAKKIYLFIYLWGIKEKGVYTSKMMDPKEQIRDFSHFNLSHIFGTILDRYITYFYFFNVVLLKWKGPADNYL